MQKSQGEEIKTATRAEGGNATYADDDVRNILRRLGINLLFCVRSQKSRKV